MRACVCVCACMRACVSACVHCVVGLCVRMHVCVTCIIISSSKNTYSPFRLGQKPTKTEFLNKSISCLIKYLFFYDYYITWCSCSQHYALFLWFVQDVLIVNLSTEEIYINGGTINIFLQNDRSRVNLPDL